MTTNIDINQLFENAMKDPSLLSNIDVEKMLDSLENDRNDYLENKTIESVIKEIYDRVNELPIETSVKQHYCKQLSEYRLVNDIHELHKGKHIKWIRVSNQRLIAQTQC
jgi:hypothetical protein